MNTEISALSRPQRRRLPWGMVVLLLLALCTAVTAAGPARAADGETVKVFVVDEGGASTLESVAEGTLGASGRASEIFDLNRGLTQPDGAALTDPNEVLRSGWILRLPADASGPDVQLARDTADQDSAESAQPGGGKGQAATEGSLTLPLTAVVAGATAVLLALVTAAIVARRRLRKVAVATGAWLSSLADPLRRRLRLRLRRTIGTQFQADTASLRRAYEALDEITATDGGPEVSVHALGLADGGVTAWLTPPGADVPWTHVEGSKWQRPAVPVGSMARDVMDRESGRGRGSAVGCLARVGVEANGRPVFIDVSQLDGVLSVVGHPTVARDVVHTLLHDIARGSAGLPVTVLQGSGGVPAIPVPPGFSEQREPLTQPAPVPAQPATGRGATVVAAAARRPVKGLVVLSGEPTPRDVADLMSLCGPGGAGWTGLVCGDIPGAHWRWQAAPDGRVLIPLLELTVTVPAERSFSSAAGG